MRTIILFIINLLVGVWCGLHSANAAPLPGMPVADVHSKSAAEEVGWRQQWYRGYVSSALRILPACLYLLSSTASRLLRTCLSGAPLLPTLWLLPALLRCVLIGHNAAAGTGDLLTASESPRRHMIINARGASSGATDVVKETANEVRGA